MKRISKKQKFWAVLGAGLLVAAASGSAFAMRTAEEKKSTTQISPTLEPTPEPQGEIEFTGTVEVIASDLWVVGGRTVAVTAATEIKPGLTIGALAKVHAVVQADGTQWAREIEPAEDDENGNGNFNVNDNSNDDNGNGNVNSNDDNGNDDDNGNVNSNDDNGNDDDGNVNSNDDNGNDDNSNSNDGNGNGDHGNTNDDHGGNSNDDGGNSNND
jgi:hypothetical protein